MSPAPGFDQSVEQCRLWWQNGKVAAVAGPLERFRCFTDKGPGDHAADIERIEQAAHHLAKCDKPIEAKMHLMRRDLENAVA